MAMAWEPFTHEGHEFAYTLVSGDYKINASGGDPVLHFKGECLKNPSADHSTAAPFWGTILNAMAGADKHAAENA